MHDEDFTPAPSSRRRPRGVLAVRMLVAKLAWLDGALYWRDGRIVWVMPERELAPGPSELAQAQWSLHKLKQYPLAGPQALGDAEGWIAERQRRLELAKTLATLTAADVEALSEAAREGSTAAIEKLTSLLLAEALCLNGLPTSPAAALLGGRERSAPFLQRCADDSGSPLAGRALAVLTLGALYRKLEQRAASPRSVGPEWLGRAYRWGRQSGLSEEPGLVTTLLAEPDGAQLAHRVLAATDPQQYFRLEPTFLRELLVQGTPAATVVELAEAIRDAAPVAERYFAVRHLLPTKLKDRRETAEALQRQRQAWVDTFGALLLGYTRSADPAPVRLATSFALKMLGHSPHTTPLATAIHQALREVSELPRPLQAACLELFVSEHERIWPNTIPQTGSSQIQQSEDLKHWLDQQWSQHGAPVKRLLAAAPDPDLVREVLSRGLVSVMSHLHLPSLDYYRYVLSLVRELDLKDEEGSFWRLSNLLRDLPTVAAARTTLQPLIRAVAGAPHPQRGTLLLELLHEVPYARKQVREMTARLAHCVPALLQFSLTDDAWTVCSGAVEAAGALAKGAPVQAADRLATLLSAVSQWLRTNPSLTHRLYDLGRDVRLGLALAEDDPDVFLTIVLTALSHPPQQTWTALEYGSEALSRFPGLRAALVQVFPRQPHRCLELLARLGLAGQLGAELLAPLQTLEAPGRDPKADPAWREVLQLAPDLESLARSFIGAQELLGRSSSPPPGVQRALALPRKLAGELAHLERRAAVEEVDGGITGRIANLRTRLQDPARLETGIRDEIRERLTDTTAAARLAAAEQQVTACYRARLDQVAGPLPPDLELSEDWLNAALLSAGISSNRQLLKRLLRACAAGDHQWREQHPENVRFLQTLAERGVDADAWQRAHPRRYPCPEMPGGVLRLRFEHDPLHILQMGNYFDTCLSFDGCNNYSTIANACELNKRVLYARDASGRVIARKLIGINADGGLIGYMTYTGLSGESGEAVRRLVRHYVSEFAQRCGLPLANEGTVPRLFAERWYDDGLWRWDDDAAPLPRKKAMVHE